MTAPTSEASLSEQPPAVHQAIDHLSAALLEVQIVLRSLDRDQPIDKAGLIGSLTNADRDLHQLAAVLERMRESL